MMIKYFHELTEGEFKALPDMTWAECAKDYPQPIWCSYPEAVQGVMGCWSLMCFMVTGRSYCKNCDCYIKKSRRLNETHKDKAH